jgi:hypothetical protein
MVKVPTDTAKTVIELRTFFHMPASDCITALYHCGVCFAMYKTAMGVLVVFVTSNSENHSLLSIGNCGVDEKHACVACTNDPVLGTDHRITITEVDAHMCSFCLERCSFKCSQCWYRRGVAVRYCGRECQLDHWQRHKDFCGKEF